MFQVIGPGKYKAYLARYRMILAGLLSLTWGGG